MFQEEDEEPEKVSIGRTKSKMDPDGINERYA